MTLDRKLNWKANNIALKGDPLRALNVLWVISRINIGPGWKKLLRLYWDIVQDRLWFQNIFLCLNRSSGSPEPSSQWGLTNLYWSFPILSSTISAGWGWKPPIRPAKGRIMHQIPDKAREQPTIYRRAQCAERPLWLWIHWRWQLHGTSGHKSQISETEAKPSLRTHP